MAFALVSNYSLLIFILLLLAGCSNASMNSRAPSCWPLPPNTPIAVAPVDVDNLQFALNVEFLEAEFFLRGALGKGLDAFAPQLANGGPPPIGGRKAHLDPLTFDIIREFGFEEIGHLRIIEETVGPIERPLIDLSVENFAGIFDEVMGYPLIPPFDPYKSSLNFMLASYAIPYMGLVGYVGANPNTIGYASKRLLAGLLGVEAGQDAVIRARLYERKNELVLPYGRTVAEFTDRISLLRNNLAGCGIKDEGIVVPPWLGAENRTTTNILAADVNSLSYPRIPAEILRVLYTTGDERKPGGFYPRGANGRIAQGFLSAYS